MFYSLGRPMTVLFKKRHKQLVVPVMLMCAYVFTTLAIYWYMLVLFLLAQPPEHLWQVNSRVCIMLLIGMAFVAYHRLLGHNMLTAGH